MGWKDIARRVDRAGVRKFREDAGAVLYRPQEGTPFEPASGGVFTAAHEVVTLNETEGTEVSSTAPVLGIHLPDFAIPPKRGDGVDINGEAYAVDDIKPDSEGQGAMLVLKKLPKD
ncbi:MAG: hypothetical protein AB1405_01910 [Bdellovibrionota bacterium]